MRKHKRVRALFFALTACLISGGHLQASVTGGNVTTTGKVFQYIAPPVNVGNNNQQNNSTLYAFDEKQAVQLTSPLTVNESPGGGVAVIPAGTWISSHYVFFDPSSNQTVDGTVDFDEDVLGIVTDLAELNASDFLGSDATSYNSPSLRGLESGDSATVSGLSQVTVHFYAGSPGDYVRVITVPEPTSLTSLLLIAVSGVHRRRKFTH